MYPLANMVRLLQNKHPLGLLRRLRLLSVIQYALVDLDQEHHNVKYLAMHDVEGFHLLFTVDLVGLRLP